MRSRPVIEYAAHFGYLARGVLYATIGVLAIQASFRLGGAATDARGALHHIFSQPYGSAMLILLSAGLLGHAIWKCIQAVLDTEEKGRNLRGLIQRLIYFGVAIVYVGLFIVSIEILSGFADGSNKSHIKQWVYVFMSHRPGEWLVLVSGICVAGAGLNLFYLTLTAKFLRRFELHKMSRFERLTVSMVGRIGHAARGIVFSIIGVSLVRAALDYNPGEAWDFGQSLRMILHQPYGRWLLAAVAIGILTYGIYCLWLARYRRIELSRANLQAGKRQSMTSRAQNRS